MPLKLATGVKVMTPVVASREYVPTLATVIGAPTVGRSVQVAALYGAAAPAGHRYTVVADIVLPVAARSFAVSALVWAWPAGPMVVSATPWASWLKYPLTTPGPPTAMAVAGDVTELAAALPEPLV